MTLILMHASKDYVLQVTDRLVTRGKESFDPLANKNIVYGARNALVTMGFTGHAFIGDIPTDQWIAECLTGHKFDRNRKPPALTSRPLDAIDLGLSLRRLKGALDGASIAPRLRSAWISSSFTLCIEGWQWSKTRFRPLLAWLNKHEGNANFELGYATRYWFCERVPYQTGPRRSTRCMFGAAPRVNISQDRVQEIKNRLRSATPEEAEGVLVDAIRDVSTRVPQVGAHCISILISPPPIGIVRVRYIPQNGEAGEAGIRTAMGDFRIPVAFSPWLIGPSVISSPSAFSGRWEMGLGTYAIVLDGPSGRPGGPEIMMGQRRPPAP